MSGGRGGRGWRSGGWLCSQHCGLWLWDSNYQLCELSHVMSAADLTSDEWRNWSDKAAAFMMERSPDALRSEAASAPRLSRFPVSFCCIFLSLNSSVWATRRKTSWIRTLITHVQSHEAFPMENLFPSRIWLLCHWSRMYWQGLWMRIKCMSLQLYPLHHSPAGETLSHFLKPNLLKHKNP